MVNGYFVNGQAPDSDKFAYKMRWLDGLRRWLSEQMSAHGPLVLVETKKDLSQLKLPFEQQQQPAA